MFINQYKSRVKFNWLRCSGACLLNDLMSERESLSKVSHERSQLMNLLIGVMAHKCDGETITIRVTPWNGKNTWQLHKNIILI